MYYKVDYYSFTIPIDAPIERASLEAQSFIINSFLSLGSYLAQWGGNLSAWEVESAKGFYTFRLRHLPTGVTLSWGKVNPHIFVEVSGSACDNLESVDALVPLVRDTCTRCSRIDFAVDIETQTDPVSFSASLKNKAVKSNGHQKSPTGETVYLGGRASENFVRIYRYNPPHPRSHLLRAEVECKGDAAKVAAAYLVATDVKTACLAAHARYDWQHPDWQPDAHSLSKLAFRHYSRSDASTVKWLYGDVVTALNKAVKNGIVDLDDWLRWLNSQRGT